MLWSIISNILLRWSSEDRKLCVALHNMTGISPGNLSLYKLALQHRSIHNGQSSNERLEFLGDAVLSLVIGEYLFKKYPHEEEGFLSEIRSRIVNRASLGNLAKKIGIQTLLQYDKKATQRGGKFIYGNALEALIGAIYLDKGYKSCQRFILQRLLRCHIDLHHLIHNDTNYKSQLVAWANKSQQQLQFEIVKETCVQGIREFTAHAVIDGKIIGSAQGNSKKQAEQNAALQALQSLTPASPLD